MSKMELIFADDSKQYKPSRLGSGRFVAIGGIHVSAERAGTLERQLAHLCNRTGFPRGEQFKWSPGAKESFMRTHLKGARRTAFYSEVIEIAKGMGVTACVVVVDTNANPANHTSKSPEQDATTLFLERVSNTVKSSATDGVVVVATPSGGAMEGERFAAECLGLIESGTDHQDLANLPFGVLTAHSRQMRVLQLADAVTSCVVARVSGEGVYSKPVFEMIRPLLQRRGGRVGGAGLKLHPEYRYINLYHWLLEETTYSRNGALLPLPERTRPFANHPEEAIVAGELARERQRAEERRPRIKPPA